MYLYYVNNLNIFAILMHFIYVLNLYNVSIVINLYWLLNVFEKGKKHIDKIGSQNETLAIENERFDNLLDLQ